MIVSNPIIKECRYIPLLFKTSIFGEMIKPGGFYRPLYMFSFMLDYHLWGLKQEGYHIFNIIFHVLNSLLLYILLIRIGLKRNTAWLSALLFALLPVNTEAVTLIAGRVELIFGFLALSCILLFLEGVRKQAGVYFLMSAALFILSVFTKESFLMLPFVILAYILILIPKEKRRPVMLPLSVLLGISFIYIGLRFFILGSPFHNTLSLINEAGFLERLYTLPKILLTYIGAALFPIVLKSEYHFVVHSARDVYVWAGIPALLLIFILINRFLRPRRHALFFTCWFFIGLVPYSNIIIPLHATLMEHWGYFSFMGLSVLASMAVFRINEIAGRRYKSILIVFVALLGLFYVFRTIERNKEWKNPFILYQNDVRREPDSFLLHCNLGVEYFRRGMMEEARNEFIASNNSAPGIGYDVAYNNLGVICARKGNIPEAIRCYKTSIALNNYVLAYANLGELYNKLQRYDDAKLLLLEGARLYPLNAEIGCQLEIANRRGIEEEAVIPK